MIARRSLLSPPVLSAAVAALALVSLSCEDDNPTNPNLPPVAIFTTAPDSGDVKTEFAVDASPSYDGQDAASALRFRWDWESDGVWDTEFSAASMDTHVYSTADTMTIRLEVRDTGGLSDSTSASVVVTVASPPPPPPPSRATAEELLEQFFVSAYSSKDSVLYSDALAQEFTFMFLPEDAESLRAGGILPPGEDSWGLTLDLQSTGKMFRSSNVGDVSLDILVSQNSPYDSSDCIGCRELETQITLSVTTGPTSTDPLIYVVDSPQQFVVSKDPADTTKWVVAKQIDRSPFGFRKGASTEAFTWGRLKGLFR